MKFILSTNEDLSPLIEIIKERIEWMDDSKINQWNKTDYLSVFPLQYFIEQQKLERLYLVKDTKDKIPPALKRARAGMFLKTLLYFRRKEPHKHCK